MQIFCSCSARFVHPSRSLVPNEGIRSCLCTVLKVTQDRFNLSWICSKRAYRLLNSAAWYNKYFFGACNAYCLIGACHGVLTYRNSPWFKLRYSSSKAKWLAASLPHSIVPWRRMSRIGATGSSDFVAVIAKTKYRSNSWFEGSQTESKVLNGF